MRRTVIALLLLVSGAAATAVAQPAKQNTPAPALQKGHCAIGVISHLGETFHVRKSSGVPIQSWYIDDLVVDKIRAALGKRAVVQRIPYRKDVVAEVRRSEPTVFGAQFKESNRWLTIGMRCARYVIVSRGSEYYGEYDSLVGLGMRINRDLFFPTYAFVYAVIDIEVYDGETFSRLRWTVSRAPHRKVDESFWPDSPESVESVAQNAKLREVTRELVAQGLDETLPKLLPTLTSRNARP